MKKDLLSHYVQLTTILRRYFDREYDIDTLESTTDETVEALTMLKLDAKLVSCISELLIKADYVNLLKVSLILKRIMHLCEVVFNS